MNDYMFVWLILEHYLCGICDECYKFSVVELNSNKSCCWWWWLYSMKSVAYYGMNKCYILESCLAIICQRGRLLFLFYWLYFAKQQHWEVSIVFKINLACLSCIEVRKWHMMDTMSQHVGTTYRACVTSHWCCILEDILVKDWIIFYC